MRYISKFLFVAAMVVILARPCLAQRHGSFCAVEALGGWGQANFKTKQDYHFIPFYIDIDFDFKSLCPGLKQNYPGLLQFQIEPAFSYVTQPNKNMEAAAVFALKAGLFPETWRLQPYVKAAIGGIYMTQHSPIQSTQLNFCEYAGAGAHYFIGPANALSLELRYRHVSNAGLKKPNRGISGYITLIGLAHKF
jgi:hypothetical protein